VCVCVGVGVGANLCTDVYIAWLWYDLESANATTNWARAIRLQRVPKDRLEGGAQEYLCEAQQTIRLTVHACGTLLRHA
jgi:hypothetical protein